MGTNLNNISITLGFGFLAGLFFSPIVDLPIYILGLVFLFILVLSFLRKSTEIFLISVFVFSFCFGYFYFKMDNARRVSSFEIEDKTNLSFDCSVAGDVEIKNNKKRFQCIPILKDKKVKEKFLIYTTDIEKDFLYGDILSMEAVFEKPKPFITDTNTQFDYDEFLKTKNIFYLSFDAKIKEIERKNSFRRKLFEFRDGFMRPFAYKLKGDTQNLFEGILFGKNILSNELSDDFRITGLTHIIALSGYNITVIASWARTLFLKLGINASALLSALSIVLFILMTGVPVTAVRAGIMAGVSILALRMGNIYASLQALFVAALVMSIINPRLVFYDFSFQLSVLATLGIILFTKKFVSILPFKKPFILKEIIATTISAQIAVLPLILYQTRLLSVLSLPANIVVLPIIPAIMVVGFLGGVVGLLSSVLAFPFVLLSEFLLKIIIFISEFTANLSISAFVFKDFGILVMLALYVLIGFWAYKSRVLNIDK